MSLIATEIKELRQMVKHLDAGKVTPEHVRSKLGIYKETFKRVKLIADVTIACGNPKAVGNKLNSMNIMSQGEFVTPAVEIEMETIRCPDMNDEIITREKCLDYSGDSKNLKTCKSCEHFGRTRKLICPKR